MHLMVLSVTGARRAAVRRSDQQKRAALDTGMSFKLQSCATV